ncbi:unnamed protein product [Euphydryas editha]|uniref:Uncharacterized protein n=1 Tax=Euphydryas editha TaxID=104508 RepID=A0AAU9V5U5_EUPED|nr:unnamed protein product [Euphydryas editha]
MPKYSTFIRLSTTAAQLNSGNLLKLWVLENILGIDSAYIQLPWLMMYADESARRREPAGRCRVNPWKDTLENGGLKLNVANTEYMRATCESPGSSTIQIGLEPAV